MTRDNASAAAADRHLDVPGARRRQHRSAPGSSCCRQPWRRSAANAIYRLGDHDRRRAVPRLSCSRALAAADAAGGGPYDYIAQRVRADGRLLRHVELLDLAVGRRTRRSHRPRQLSGARSRRSLRATGSSVAIVAIGLVIMMTAIACAACAPPAAVQIVTTVLKILPLIAVILVVAVVIGGAIAQRQRTANARATPVSGAAIAGCGGARALGDARLRMRRRCRRAESSDPGANDRSCDLDRHADRRRCSTCWRRSRVFLLLPVRRRGEVSGAPFADADAPRLGQRRRPARRRLRDASAPSGASNGWVLPRRPKCRWRWPSAASSRNVFARVNEAGSAGLGAAARLRPDASRLIADQPQQRDGRDLHVHHPARDGRHARALSRRRAGGARALKRGRQGRRDRRAVIGAVYALSRCSPARAWKRPLGASACWRPACRSISSCVGEPAPARRRRRAPAAPPESSS